MIKVLIYEDDRRYWDTLRHLLDIPGEITVQRISDNTMSCTADVLALRPDVVIMDINLPRKDGIQAVFEIRKVAPEVRIIMFTVYDDTENIFNAIRAGAVGYILKYEASRVAGAVREVYEGKASINGFIAGMVLKYFQEVPAPRHGSHDLLTPRENEILQLLNGGLPYKQIAHECGISPQTLNTHIKNIYSKLNVHSRAEIAARFRNS